MFSVKRYISHLFKFLSPSTQKKASKFWGALSKNTSHTVSLVRHNAIKTAVMARRVRRHTESLPRITKMFIVLLSLVCIFVVWQLFAYHLPQSTFISINLAISVILTAFACFVVVKTQHVIDDGNSHMRELKDLCERRDEEITKLKADIYDMRKKERRRSAVGKSSERFVEAVRRLHSRRTDDGPRYQYVLSAMSKCFENLSGAVIFANTHDEEGHFEIAGSYALAKDPHSRVVTAADGVIGQVITDQKIRTLDRVPNDYLAALSGLGRSQAINIYVLPFSNTSGTLEAVAEIACFGKLSVASSWEEIKTSLQDIFDDEKA